MTMMSHPALTRGIVALRADASGDPKQIFAELQRSFEAFKAEVPNQQDFQPDPKAKWAGLLEKKWTSVIRLQKKVGALQARRSEGIRC